jgi:hypothetical protein
MKRSRSTRLVVCIDNRGNEIDLKVGKVYAAPVTEKIARDDRLIRVIDDSGEDYLFSADQFIELKLPRAAKEALLRAR